jgi:K+-transporting ATPase c subunit
VHSAAGGSLINAEKVLGAVHVAQHRAKADYPWVRQQVLAEELSAEAAAAPARPSSHPSSTQSAVIGEVCRTSTSNSAAPRQTPVTAETSGARNATH